MAQETSLDALSSMLKLFSGTKQNSTQTTSGGTTTTQTQLSPESVQALLQKALEQNGGLADVASGQRTSGMYNSTVNQQLTNDLLARISTNVAAAAAPTVKTSTPTETKTIQATPGALGGKSTAMGMAALSLGNQLGLDKLLKGKLKSMFESNDTTMPSANAVAVGDNATEAPFDLGSAANIAESAPPIDFGSPNLDFLSGTDLGTDLGIGDSLFGDVGYDFDFNSLLEDTADWTDFGDFGTLFKNGGRVQHFAKGGRVQVKPTGYANPVAGAASNVLNTTSQADARRKAQQDLVDETYAASDKATTADVNALGSNTIAQAMGGPTANMGVNNTPADPNSPFGGGLALQGLLAMLGVGSPLMVMANIISSATTGKTLFGNIKEKVSSVFKSNGTEPESKTATPDIVSAVTPEKSSTTTSTGGWGDYDSSSDPFTAWNALGITKQQYLAQYGMDDTSSSGADSAATYHINLGNYTSEDAFTPDQIGEMFGGLGVNVGGDMFTPGNANISSGALGNVIDLSGLSGLSGLSFADFPSGSFKNGGPAKPATPTTIGIRGHNAPSEGGKLAGHDTEGKDNIHIAVSGGEYIIPTDVVDKVGQEFFDKLLEQYHTEV